MADLGEGEPPARWWTRPAFYCLAYALGAFFSWVLDWFWGGPPAPPLRLIRNIFLAAGYGFVFGLGGNWIVARTKRRAANAADPPSG